MRSSFTIGMTALTAPLVVTSLSAAEMNLSVAIPRLNVAEYHRPYVAIWLESGDKITNLAVWYDVKQKQNEGTKWLKDMRQWWRRTGRELTMPTDGLSSATRAPGQHDVNFSEQAGKIAPGQYELVVEAAREVGGRELLRLPFQWPPAAAQSLKADGSHELGTVTLSIKP
ncbi:hypothetical protein GJW-30_1_03988 [Variibacter gotjawalensis]|uniref:DUF2271 domain-containing protein n=1 Tax=Variibacter gotjawalensis TaxID=1333996 RepID=A0A0S3PZS2_9BRAD|nr:DUF2271 domain-containing protein [Variibacter gotjawalensis]NIK47269.1 hypothetical protein [Variibacter gotjawalensis]RZS49169.1 hypothetical protein EV661_1595 [Variibacter gotjawalensis]BAT61431.1 hypothetical protein GJW-30_1_03988 [Variibacter gotjawalensis]